MNEHDINEFSFGVEDEFNLNDFEQERGRLHVFRELKQWEVQNPGSFTDKNDIDCDSIMYDNAYGNDDSSCITRDFSKRAVANKSNTKPQKPQIGSTVRKSPDIAIRKSQDIAIRKSQDIAIRKSQDIGVKK